MYRSQLGMVLHSEGENPNKKYVIIFQDRDEYDSILGEEKNINELELSLDEVIPLILPCSLVEQQKGNEVDFYGECYFHEMYTNKNIRDEINSNLNAVVELPQDEYINSDNIDKNLEFVACPEANSFYISHDYTEFQWKRMSLVTFAKVCYFRNNHDYCIYPGQIGVIKTASMRVDLRTSEYVEVFLSNADLDGWNNYIDYEQSDEEFLAENNGTHIYINQYNLVPIFQNKLTALSDEIEPIDIFFKKFSLSIEEYETKLRIDKTLSEETIQAKIKLFKYMKERSEDFARKVVNK